MTEWYQFPVTLGHGSSSGGPFDWEAGVDLGTANDTPLYFPWNCTVIDASYQTYGGQVACEVDGQNMAEYFIHLDNIYVKTGEHISAGEIVGTSGGGLGDNVLHNGSVQPAQSQSWFVNSSGGLASTGYHTEFGEFVASNMQQFDADWNNHNNQIDPTNTITQLLNGGIGGVANPSTQAPPCNAPAWCQIFKNTPMYNQLPMCQCANAGVQNVPGVSGIANAFSNPLGLTSSGLMRVGVGALGVVMVAIGIMGIVHGDTIAETIANPVGTIVKKAA